MAKAQLVKLKQKRPEHMTDRELVRRLATICDMRDDLKKERKKLRREMAIRLEGYENG